MLVTKLGCFVNPKPQIAYIVFFGKFYVRIANRELFGEPV